MFLKLRLCILLSVLCFFNCIYFFYYKSAIIFLFLLYWTSFFIYVYSEFIKPLFLIFLFPNLYSFHYILNYIIIIID